MEQKEKILLLFSGGKDSLLSAVRLAEKDYIVNLVTYDNGCGLGIQNALDGVNRLISKYGEESIKYVGTHSVRALFREFFLPIYNMKPSEIVERYGQLPISQLNCLMCRSAMYIYSIALCKILEINNLAEGARRSQQFVIELKEMTDLYQLLLKENGINYFLPVVNEQNDFALENELLMSGMVPKTLEPQCLLGCPIDNARPIDQEIIDATVNFYNSDIYPNVASIALKIEKPITYTLKRKDWNNIY